MLCLALPAVAIQTYLFFLKLLHFSSSAMQKGHFEPICAYTLTGSPLRLQ